MTDTQSGDNQSGSHHEVRTEATVQLSNGTEITADRVELSEGWVHIRDRADDGWHVQDIPAHRVQAVSSREFDDG